MMQRFFLSFSHSVELWTPIRYDDNELLTRNAVEKIWKKAKLKKKFQFLWHRHPNIQTSETHESDRERVDWTCRALPTAQRSGHACYHYPYGAPTLTTQSSHSNKISGRTHFGWMAIRSDVVAKNRIHRRNRIWKWVWVNFFTPAKKKIFVQGGSVGAIWNT